MRRLLPYVQHTLACVLCAAPAAHAATLYGPTPYFAFADSPFAALGTPYLETFEDGVLNTAGVTASSGTVLAPGGLTDSVDADDGAIDGSGTAGRSWYSNGSTVMAFSFDAGVLGALPTHVGIVWTDVGFRTGTGQQLAAGEGSVTLRAYDATNALVATLFASGLGDGAAGGATGEDRFFGIASAGGIGRIEFEMTASDDWEADHLQYGVFPVPVPAPLGLLLVGLAALGSRVRRKP